MSLILLGLYISMLPSSLTWKNFGADGGDLLAAILTNGIPHPTGYPTYLLLGKLAQLLPFGSPYLRGALLSALSTSVASGMLSYWVISQFAGRELNANMAGGITGLVFGISPLVWSQAVIVEVNGLQALFVVLNLWWVTELIKPKWWLINNHLRYWLALAVGLSFGNHTTIILLLPIWIFVFLIGIRHGAPWREIFFQILLIAADSLVYILLPLWASKSPPLNWGDPQTMSGFVWQITGQPYQGLIFFTPLAIVIDRFTQWSDSFLLQNFSVGLILAVIGLVMFPLHNKRVRWVTLWIAGVYTIFALGYYTNDSVVYLIPVQLTFAIWIGIGLGFLFEYLNPKNILARMILVGVILMLFIHVPTTYGKVDPRENHDAASFAEEYLIASPPNAILVTDTDRDTFSLWYYHYGLKWRPDVHVVVSKLVGFEWYQETLAINYPDLSYPSPDISLNWMEEFITLNSELPVCRSLIGDKQDSQILTECLK